MEGTRREKKNTTDDVGVGVLASNALSIPKFRTTSAFARASVASQPALRSSTSARAPTDFTQTSRRLHAHPQSNRRHHNDNPLQAHRSHLAAAVVAPTSPSPAIICSTGGTRSLFRLAQCASHSQLPRQPDPRATAQVHHLDRRHGTGALERFVSWREGCTDHTAVVQLRRCRHWRHCYCRSCINLTQAPD